MYLLCLHMVSINWRWPFIECSSSRGLGQLTTMGKLCGRALI